MKAKQLTVLLLASILLASCGADSQTDSEAETVGGEKTEAVTQETLDPNDRSQMKDNLPDTLDVPSRFMYIRKQKNIRSVQKIMLVTLSMMPSLLAIWQWKNV